MATNSTDYSSNYSIKDFAINEVAPKFFNMTNTSQINVGLLGYTTELIAHVAEDTFNAVSTYVKEIFPSQAQIPETLYNHAANLQISNLFAAPSQLNMVLFINENDINSLGTVKNGFYEFVIDSDLIVDIEGKHFMLDYDIKILSKPYAQDYIYTAQYDMTYGNTISSVQNPYIKTTRIIMNNMRYLGILVTMHQVDKFKQNELIISNDKINYPILEFNFVDQMANFEVFYTPPGATEPIQLEKRMANSIPTTNPFCFYRIVDTDKVEITFTMRDNYFQPEFNSEVEFHIYTTTGKSGDFPEYKGTDVTVIPKSSVYEYNNKLNLFAVPQGDSTQGQDSLTLEQLRAKIIEKNSTSGSYSIESDLQMYFTNYPYKDKNQVLFVKKRDDALERVFAAFALFKNTNNDFYPTNTLNIDLRKSDYDLEYQQSDRYILKAGHIFKYDPATTDKVVPIPNTFLKDNLTAINENFLYTNPFLVTLQKSPSVVGFYLNSINTKVPLDYTYVNGDSNIQFICNNIAISRNAVLGEDGYTMTVNVIPTSTIEKVSVDDNNNYNGKLKIVMTIEDSSSEICYRELTFTSYDPTTSIYTFSTVLSTDDYMTMSERFSVFNVNDIVTGELMDSKLIPMSNCVVNILAFYKYDNLNLAHKYDNLDDYQPFSLTNIYSTTTVPINFIVPLNNMRARVKYMPDETDGYYTAFSLVPLTGASSIKDPTMFTDFITLLTAQHDYLQQIVDLKTNNYGIDLKYYNTFGKSKNFVIADTGETLDRTNISIHFKVALNFGAIEELVIRDVRLFIKDYIEGINNQGYNAIYISNLMREIETTFTDVKYLKFVQINNYDSSVQVIENKGLAFSSLSKDEQKNYVPEYLTVSLSDIIIDIISS
jgi:hypothetical protein